MSIRFTLKGTAEVTRKLHRIAKDSPDEFLQAAMSEMNFEKEEMKRRTPVRYGILRDSLVVTGGVRQRRIFVSVSTDVDYAPYVHEDLDAFHEIGEAKFIESVLDESEPHMLKRIGRQIRLNRLAK